MNPEKNFYAYADPMPEPMLLSRSDGRIVAANDAAGRLLGFSSAELRGRHLGELATNDRQQLDSYLKLCARNRRLLPGTLSLRTGAGEEIRLRSDAAAVRPRQGDEPALIVLRLRPKRGTIDRFTLLNQRIEDLNREVFRRQVAERSLDAQRQRLEVTLDSIGDAVIATSEDGRVLLMNPVAELLTGWRSDEAREQPLEEVFEAVHEVTREPIDDMIATARGGKTIGLTNHTLLRHRDGSEKPIDYSIAPIRNGTDHIQGLVLTFRDISDRRRSDRERAELLSREQAARARAEAADRTKDEFLSSLSHELRAPLQVIANWTCLLQSEEVDRSTTSQALDVIERNLELQTRLIDDLLDISHIAAGAIYLETQSLELRPIVAAACEELRDDVEGKRIKLETVLDPLPLCLDGDPARLQQVVRNLVSNAIKFTPEGGRIEVALEAVPEGAKITVRDTGEGMDAEIIAQLFENFHQGDGSRTRAHGGLGLGLAIARHLTEMHGGTLTAESPGAGAGATFTVILPTIDPEHCEPEQAADDDAARG